MFYFQGDGTIPILYFLKQMMDGFAGFGALNLDLIFEVEEQQAGDSLLSAFCILLSSHKEESPVR